MPEVSRESISRYMEKHDLCDTVVVHFDGSCDPGGYGTGGCIIREPDGTCLFFGSMRFGKSTSMTNNVAEYTALGHALRWMLDHRSDLPENLNLLILGDSKLVIEQISGRWKCKKDHLIKLRDRCLEILQDLKLTTWRAQWIPREQNEDADGLARLAYVEWTGNPYPERSKK